ncbi:hypothetical protein PSPO01_15377 [Paraphaeosphaeria sporulosa]
MDLSSTLFSKTSELPMVRTLEAESGVGGYEAEFYYLTRDRSPTPRSILCKYLSRPLTIMDPLTIFGAVGTTAGLIATLLSSVASTGENLFKKHKDLQNIDLRLRGYRRRLLVANLELQNYEKIWFGQAMQTLDAEYKTRWGEEGYLEIQNMLKDIGEWNTQAERTLYANWRKHQEPEALAQPDWKANLKQRLQRIGKSHTEETSSVKKFLMAIIMTPFLNDTVDGFEKLVDVLVKFTRKTYWTRLGQQDQTKEPSIEDIRHGDLEDLNLKRLTDAMDDLYRNPRATEESWMLVLDSCWILQRGFEELRYEPDFNVRFVTRKYSFYQIDISIEQEERTLRPDIKSIDSPHSHSAVPLGQILDLCKGIRVSQSQQRLAFAKIARNIANSYLLLKSIWTADLCTYCIKTVGDLCAFRHIEGPSNRHSRRVSNNFYNFGLVLAQLGIGEPFDRDDESQLLGMVLKRAGPRYHDAIEACFDLGRLEHEFRAEHIKRGLEAVAKPLEEYYQRIHEEFKLDTDSQ